MKLTTWHSNEEKSRWKVVRTDNYADLPGEIVTADEESGECRMHIAGETKELCFGPRSIRITMR